MEEILASIRKIIAEDQKALDAKLGPGPIATVPLELAPAVNDDVEPQPEPLSAAYAAEPVAIEEQRPVEVPQTVVTRLEPRAVSTDALPVQPVVMPQPAIQPATVQPVSPAAHDGQRLLSDDTAMAAGLAFQSLSQTVAKPARTMDELVSDMLRPMLSAWLDDNLPALVERLVKAEIERVSRGGR